MSSLLKEFKDFAAKGNVIDLAVGVVVGGAFGKIVTSFVDDILMPPIGIVLGRVNFSSLYLNLSGKAYPSLAAAKEAGAATINYGAFITNVIDFLIIAFVIFLFVRQINRLQTKIKRPEEKSATTKQCPFCLTSVPLQATRCAACTSDLKLK